METNSQEKIKQQIIKEVDMSGIADSQKNEIVSQLLDDILLKINIAVFDRLQEEDRENIANLLESDDKSGIMDFLESKIEDLPELAEGVVKETIEEFKKLSAV